MRSTLLPFISCPTDIIYDWCFPPQLLIKYSEASEEQGSL